MTQLATNSAATDFVRRFIDTIEAMPPIETVEDDVVVSLLADTMTERETIVQQLDAITHGLRAEIERRLKERRAAEPASTEKIALPHPRVEIVLEPQYSPYSFRIESLQAAAQSLPDDERAKILKHVAEQVTIVPAHDEPGAAVSITALQKKYAGSTVGNLLKNAMTRERLGDQLTVKPIAPKLPAKRAR